MTQLISVPLAFLMCVACAAAKPPPTDANSSASPDKSGDDPIWNRQNMERYPSAQRAAYTRQQLLERRNAPVVVLQSTDALMAGQQLCEKVVPQRPAKTPVLLKPNLSGINRLQAGIDNGVELRTTGIEFLRGVIRCLKARGHTRITITETWTRPKSFQKWMKTTGLDKLLKEERVQFVGMWDDKGQFGKRSPMLWAPHEGAKALKEGLLLPRLLHRHLGKSGLFISIPRLKMHRFSVTTLGIKNNMGFVATEGASPTKSKRSKLHKEVGPWFKRFRKTKVHDKAAYQLAGERFAERIVDVFELALPDAVLIDGVPAVSGDGFALVEPLRGGVAIGSVNPVWAEAVGTEYMGYLDNAELEAEIGHRAPPILEEAARRFYGSTDVIHNVAIEGWSEWRKSGRKPAFYRGFPKFEIGQREEPRAPLPWEERALTVKRAITPPVLDGRLDDAAWTRADVIRLDTDWKGEPSGPETIARLAWTPQGLYFAFDCAYQGLNVPPEPIATEHKKLYSYDAVELFIDSSPRSSHTYVEVEVGPKGHFMDIAVNRKKRPRGNVAWASGLEVKTHIDSATKRYVVEGLVPAPALVAKGKGPLKPGTWRMGLYRIDGKKPNRTHLARFPTYTKRPGFHVPNAFGWVRLVP